MKPVVFSSTARAELDAAAAYYESQRPGLGRDFRAEVDRIVRLLEQNPGMGTLVGTANVRRKGIAKFPYNLVYLEQDSCVLIIAVAHQKRRPGYWMNRLP